jgi:hypothetical protein
LAPRGTSDQPAGRQLAGVKLKFTDKYRISPADPGCAKTPVFNLLVESSSQFGESENKNAGDGYPRKAIEKLVLRFLGSHTFSHGLDP